MTASKPLAVTLLFLATFISIAVVVYTWYQGEKESLAWNFAQLNSSEKQVLPEEEEMNNLENNLETEENL
jgi:hypothetical protein